MHSKAMVPSAIVPAVDDRQAWYTWPYPLNRSHPRKSDDQAFTLPWTARTSPRPPKLRLRTCLKDRKRYTNKRDGRQCLLTKRLA